MTVLSCENEFCIYQKQGSCILESVQLDTQGGCQDCIYVTVEEDTLSDLKERLLSKLGL